MSEWIASQSFLLIRAAGERAPIVVRVGRPQPTADGDWSCAVALDGLHPGEHAIRGEGSLHALSLACSLVASLLRFAVEDEGNHLLWPEDGSSVDLDALFPGFVRGE